MNKVDSGGEKAALLPVQPCSTLTEQRNSIDLDHIPASCGATCFQACDFSFAGASGQCRTNRAAPWTLTVYDIVRVTVPKSVLLHTSLYLQVALPKPSMRRAFPMSDICADIVVLFRFRLKRARYISPIVK